MDQTMEIFLVKSDFVSLTKTINIKEKRHSLRKVDSYL